MFYDVLKLDCYIVYIFNEIMVVYIIFILFELMSFCIYINSMD